MFITLYFVLYYLGIKLQKTSRLMSRHRADTHSPSSLSKLLGPPEPFGAEEGQGFEKRMAITDVPFNSVQWDYWITLGKCAYSSWKGTLQSPHPARRKVTWNILIWTDEGSATYGRSLLEGMESIPSERWQRGLCQGKDTGSPMGKPHLGNTYIWGHQGGTTAYGHLA